MDPAPVSASAAAREREPSGGPAPATLGETVRVLVRAWPVVVLSTALGVGLALALAFLARPTFSARATILIEQESSSGLLGDLAMLASIASAPATSSELSVLESRSLAASVVPDGAGEGGAWDPLDERHAGLLTLVDDHGLRPLELLRRALSGTSDEDVPLVLPERGLFARVVDAPPGAPRRIELQFLGPTRVRVRTAGLGQRLHVADAAPEELEYASRKPLAYRGLVLELETWGDLVGESFTIEHLAPHEAVDRLRERLRVRETALNSGVIEIVVDDTDPRRAARTVNALCLGYMDSLSERGQRRASRTVEYVSGLLDDELERFARAQDEVMQLQQSHPDLIAPENAAGSFLDQLARLEVERVQLDLSRRVFADIVEALETGDSRALARIDDTLDVGVLVDPVTSALLVEIARLEAQASTYGADLLDDHPLVAQNREASAALVARTREQIRSRIEGLEARDAELGRVEGELRGRLTGMPEGLRKLSETHVELAIHRELVPYLIKSLQGAEITRSTAETRAELIDPAVPPTEITSPDFPRLLALGLLLGLAAGMVAAFVREPARGRVHTGAELASALGVPEALELERLPQRGFLFTDAAAGPGAETLRRLRAALRYSAEGPVRTRIGVTGLAADAAGLAAELALAYAAEGRRTLLVEADLARPALAARFGVAGDDGLARLLAAGGSWEELVHAGPGGVEVLPAGRSAAPALEELARPALERFLAEAAAQRDVLLVALPDAERLPACPALLRALDVVVVAHRARTLPRARIASAARALRAAGARALAGVLVRKR